MGRHETFFAILTKAINDFLENGFDSQRRLDLWLKEIRLAAERMHTPDHVVLEMLRRSFDGLYRREVGRGGLLRLHPGVSRFALDRVAPELHSELDRAIMASASLIKLNREQATLKTVQRFAGWASSIPAGGTRAENRVKAKAEIKKALPSLTYVERRVAIDQGHKFAASLNRIVAEGGGAIAAKWRSHKHQAGYDGRPAHNERDGKIFLIRNSWADEKGFVKAGSGGYTDEIEEPGQLVFCRCFYVYLYSLSRLPEDMLTDKGRAELARLRAEAA